MNKLIAQEKQWMPIFKKMTVDGIKTSFLHNLHDTLAKDQYTATIHDNFSAIAIAVRDRIVERWITTQQKYHKKNLKRVYYLSMEFLIGRLLLNNLINLGLLEQSKKALADLGFNIEDILDQEKDAGLGNGGLGRLAACFLDSMTTLGIPAHGYGIRYDYGIFRQKISNGQQVEYPDEWLKLGNPWEFARPEYEVKIRFYGKTHSCYDADGKFRVTLTDTHDVIALPYDIPITGYKNNIVNTLRLWSARSTEEFDLDYFNHGDYERAVDDKVISENISKVLYPSDFFMAGRELRLKQEYFLVAASIADIIRRFRSENKDLKNLPDKVAIQLNDTHPSLGILELMRILLDEENFNWDTAWNVTVNTFAYTNHTVMPEALEVWPVPLFQNLLPRHLEIIYEINARFLRQVSNKYIGDNDRLRRMSIIEEGHPKKVRMANLSIIGTHSTNGVSKLHSQLLKTELFKDFYEFFPERFNNKTNGITQRRWLKGANPALSNLITSVIGDKWITDLEEMEKLIKFTNNKSFLEKWQKVKLNNKRLLSNYINKNAGVSINPDSLFDVQVKRIHEYKRQLLFGLYIISEYLKLKKGPKEFITPRTFILGGKAAPSYFTAKLIIRFINNIADVINKDKTINGKLKVIFLEDYNVSLAEKIFPASDLSEQISTAGTEASGTGCMKFMLNGALTIGTLDGANIEIAEAVGKNNIFIFGLKTGQIEQLRYSGYNPNEYINKSDLLKEAIELIKNDFFSPFERGIFNPIIQNLTNADPFFICADFESYAKTQNIISKKYLNPDEWAKISIINAAKSGIFSSDRTILEYAKDIWKIPIAE